MKKILIMEDDPHFCSLLETSLVATGYEVRTAGDGQSGVSLALTWHPDLILVDLDLPVKNGISSIQELREKGFRGKIAVLTEHPGGGNVLKSVMAGADNILVKPFQEQPDVMVKNIFHKFVG